ITFNNMGYEKDIEYQLYRLDEMESDDDCNYCKDKMGDIRGELNDLLIEMLEIKGNWYTEVKSLKAQIDELQNDEEHSCNEEESEAEDQTSLRKISGSDPVVIRRLYKEPLEIKAEDFIKITGSDPVATRKLYQEPEIVPKKGDDVANRK
ncbi:hypothetical protein HK097_006089, partial [Rhizophlyctis rosea]